MDYTPKQWDGFYELAKMEPGAREAALAPLDGAAERYADMAAAARQRAMTQAEQVGRDKGDEAFVEASENKGALDYGADMARGAHKAVGQVFAIPSAIWEGSFAPLDTAENAAEQAVPSHEGRTGRAANVDEQVRYLMRMQMNGVELRPGGGLLTEEEIRATVEKRAESARALHGRMKSERDPTAHFAEGAGEWGLPFFGIFGKGPKAAQIAGAVEEGAEATGKLAKVAGVARNAFESPQGRFARGAGDRIFLSGMLGMGAAYGENVLNDAEAGTALGGLTATGAALLRQGVIGKGVNFLRGGTAAIAGALGKKADAAVAPDQFLGSEIAGMGEINIPNILDAGWQADIPGAAAFRGDTAEWAAAAAARANPEVGAELAHMQDPAADALRRGVGKAEMEIPGRMMAGLGNAPGSVEGVKAYEKASGLLWRNRNLAAERARKFLPDVKAVEGAIEFNPPVEVRQVLADAGMPYSESAAKVPTLRGGGAPDAEARDIAVKIKKARAEKAKAEAALEKAKEALRTGKGSQDIDFVGLQSDINTAFKKLESLEQDRVLLAGQRSAESVAAGAKKEFTFEELLDLRSWVRDKKRKVGMTQDGNASKQFAALGKVEGMIDARLRGGDGSPSPKGWAEAMGKMDKFDAAWRDDVSRVFKIKELRTYMRGVTPRDTAGQIFRDMQLPGVVERMSVALGGGEKAWGAVRDGLSDGAVIDLARRLNGARFDDYKRSAGKGAKGAKDFRVAVSRDAVRLMMKRSLSEGGQDVLTGFGGADGGKALVRIYDTLRGTDEGAFLRVATIRAKILDKATVDGGIYKEVRDFVGSDLADMFSSAEKRALEALGAASEGTVRTRKGARAGLGSDDIQGLKKMIELVNNRAYRLMWMESAKYVSANVAGKVLGQVVQKQAGAKVARALMEPLAEAGPESERLLKVLAKAGSDKAADKRDFIKVVGDFVGNFYRHAQKYAPAYLRTAISADDIEREFGPEAADKWDERISTFNRTLAGQEQSP